MPEVLIEVHQVGENQTFIDLAQRNFGGAHAVGVVLGFDVVLNAAAQEDVENLADAVDGNVPGGQADRAACRAAEARRNRCDSRCA